MSRVDLHDPAVRAEHALRRLARHRKRARWSLAALLTAAAVTVPYAADAFVGTPGSLLGALALAGLCLGLARAVAPWTWSAEEHDHHRLEAIWNEARTDAAESVPWERFAAWAIAGEDHVVLLELVCAPSTGTAPRRLRQRKGQRFDADAIADAAGAMAVLRRELEERELAALQAHLDGRLRAERDADDAALSAVEAAAARDQHESEARMRREVARETAAERRTQAAALAQALRRP